MCISEITQIRFSNAFPAIEYLDDTHGRFSHFTDAMIAWATLSNLDYLGTEIPF